MKFLIILIVAIVLCSYSENYEFGEKGLITDLRETQWDDLKDNPSKYVNDTILISGRFHHEFEDVSINQNSEGIWLNSFNPLPITQELKDKMNDRDILILGLFNTNNKGHLGQYLGTIEEVYYLKTE